MKWSGGPRASAMETGICLAVVIVLYVIFLLSFSL